MGGALAQSAPGALLGGLSSVQTPDLVSDQWSSVQVWPAFSRDSGEAI